MLIVCLEKRKVDWWDIKLDLNVCNMLGALENKLKDVCVLRQNRCNWGKPNSGIIKHFRLRSYNLTLGPIQVSNH